MKCGFQNHKEHLFLLSSHTNKQLRKIICAFRALFFCCLNQHLCQLETLLSWARLLYCHQSRQRRLENISHVRFYMTLWGKNPTNSTLLLVFGHFSPPVQAQDVMFKCWSANDEYLCSQQQISETLSGGVLIRGSFPCSAWCNSVFWSVGKNRATQWTW